MDEAGERTRTELRAYWYKNDQCVHIRNYEPEMQCMRVEYGERWFIWRDYSLLMVLFTVLLAALLAFLLSAGLPTFLRALFLGLFRVLFLSLLSIPLPFMMSCTLETIEDDHFHWFGVGKNLSGRDPNSNEDNIVRTICGLEAEAATYREARFQVKECTNKHVRNQHVFRGWN